MDDFKTRNIDMVKSMGNCHKLKELTNKWYLKADQFEYSYHFTWLGLPIIQYPQDIIAMQELIYSIKPDLIIETGVARGGSIIFYASMLHLLGGNRKVIGIDIDIRKENRRKIDNHHLSSYINLIEGSSVDPKIINEVQEIAKSYQVIFLALDSNHEKSHVLSELRSYENLIKPNSYIIVFDTRVELTPGSNFENRPWGPGNSPMSAVNEFLMENNRFVIDKDFENKLQITECPSGYLRCII